MLGNRLPALADGDFDINEVLTEEAEEDLANAGRENTRQTYDSRFKAFANWCAGRGRAPGPRTTEANLVSYVSHLRREEIGHDTIRLSIAAIVDMNARAGHEKWPPTAKALKIYADARHEQVAAGRSPRSAPPLDMERLKLMVAECPDTLAGLRDKVVGYLSYYCRGRRSEVARFRIASVELWPTTS
jgi:site-specific recombinase XerD